jgi:hypothetical protein
LLYVCVLDTIYGLVTKKIAVGNLRKIIVTPKEDNLFLYIIIYKLSTCPNDHQVAMMVIHKTTNLSDLHECSLASTF